MVMVNLGLNNITDRGYTPLFTINVQVSKVVGYDRRENIQKEQYEKACKYYYYPAYSPFNITVSQ
jgi:hypothetical protein